MRSRTGFPSAWRGGDNSIASIALRYVLDAFILYNSFYISFVSGHKAIYIITEQVVDRLLSVNSSLRRRFWNLNDESGSLKLLFLGCALLGHQA